MQADSLAAILDEMATKHDLELLRTELTTELRSELKILRSEMNANQNALRSELSSSMNALRIEMATMKGDLTWRFIALTFFLATVVGLIGIFAG